MGGNLKSNSGGGGGGLVRGRVIMTQKRGGALLKGKIEEGAFCARGGFQKLANSSSFPWEILGVNSEGKGWR